MNDTVIVILLIVLLFIAIVAIGLLALFIIVKGKEETKLFKDSLLDIHEQTIKISSEINIRLISIVTEALLGGQPLANRDIEELDQNIKNHDKDIISSILGQETTEHLDPFAYSSSQAEASPSPEPTETLLDEGSVYKDVK
jgi:hypothetical protein